MFWDRRNRIFLLGAPMALLPSLAFLPLFTYLALAPSQTHAGSQSASYFQGLILQGLLFSTLVFLQMAGSVLVGFASSWGGLRFVALLAIPTFLLLLIVAAYTGIFFAVFVAHL